MGRKMKRNRRSEQHEEKVRKLHPRRREMLERLKQMYPQESEEQHLRDMEENGF
jgi:hypothetical protein